MQSPKQILEETMKKLSSKERKKALKWIDSLSEKDIKEFEQLTKIKLTQLLIEKYMNSKSIYSKKRPKN